MAGKDRIAFPPLRDIRPEDDRTAPRAAPRRGAARSVGADSCEEGDGPPRGCARSARYAICRLRGHSPRSSFAPSEARCVNSRGGPSPSSHDRRSGQLAVPARSRCGSTPQRRPAATSSSSRAQRSGRSSPSCAGLAPLRAMQPVLSPIARIAATSSVGESRLGRQGAELDPLVLDRAGVLARLLDQGRHHALDRRVGQVPLAGELDRRQPRPLGDRQRPARASPGRPRSSPPAGRPDGRPWPARRRVAGRPRRGRRSRRHG